MSSMPFDLMFEYFKSPASMLTCRTLYYAFNKYYIRPWCFTGIPTHSLECVNALTGFTLVIKKRSKVPSIMATYQEHTHYFAFEFRNHGEWLLSEYGFRAFATCVFDNISLPKGQLGKVLDTFCEQESKRWCILNDCVTSTWDLPKGTKMSEVTVLKHINILRGNSMRSLTPTQITQLDERIRSYGGTICPYTRETTCLIDLFPDVNYYNMAFYISTLETKVRFAEDLVPPLNIDIFGLTLVLKGFKVGKEYYGYILVSRRGGLTARPKSVNIVLVKLPVLSYINWGELTYPYHLK